MDDTENLMSKTLHLLIRLKKRWICGFSIHIYHLLMELRLKKHTNNTFDEIAEGCIWQVNKELFRWLYWKHLH